ncbi:MAG: hypothetical protein GPJ54_11290, partial [Candidatus Heimdallarchaeota archaeon]|nr:hypothetical protein [Candidatus Heimdallarchaeota archaeon]
DQRFGNLSTGDNFNYTGFYSEIEPLEFTQSLVSTISNDELENEELEHPAIINATNTGAYIISSTLSPISFDVSPALSLNQLPQIFDNLIIQLFSSIIVEVNNRNNIVITNIISNTQGINSTDESLESNNVANGPVPILQNLQIFDLLIYGLIFFILLFFAKVTRLYGWIGRKLIGVGIFVVGIFYNVEDRILAHKDVYLNNSRAEIMDFLDTVGKFGSHLREIKSKTNLASGSLMWHLKVLEDFNWIMKYKIENNTIYVSHNFESSFDPYLKKLELKLHSKYTYNLLNALKNVSYNNSITIIDIQKQVDIPNKAIRRLINKMHELEIVKINYTKPIRFQIYNFSIFNNICESLDLRENYEMIVNNIGTK